jgi:hypothetical protein
MLYVCADSPCSWLLLTLHGNWLKALDGNNSAIHIKIEKRTSNSEKTKQQLCNVLILHAHD